MRLNLIRTSLLFVVCAFFSNISAAPPNGIFNGDWQIKAWCSDNALKECRPVEHTGDIDDFRLYDFHSQGNMLCGFHLVTGNRQRRVDEGDLVGDGPSVWGKVNGLHADIKVKSALTGSEGKATLTFLNGVIVWKLIEAPEGENWFPKGAILERDHHISTSTKSPLCDKV